ncbi:MAG: hypothetical protein U0S49_12500 [Rhodospirillales bacterium]|nr:hypothetical protein [Rhodospirillales bacterium]
MASLLAPPDLLSAFACAAFDEPADADLRRGTHLRLFTGPDCFPLAPFVVVRRKSFATEPRQLHVTDRDGTVVSGGIDLSGPGVLDVIPVLSDSDTRVTVRIEVQAADPDAIGRAALFDQLGRIVAERRASRWLFSAPRFARLRLSGSTQAGLAIRAIDPSRLIGDAWDVAALPGLPVDGDHRWYVGGAGRAAALARVAEGAPLRLNPMDVAEAPFAAVDPRDEQLRVEAMLAATGFGGGIEAVLARLVDDGTDPPWRQIETQQITAPGAERRQTATLPRAAMLQFAALDPGLARLLGLATYIPDLPELHGDGGWDTLAVVGVLATAPRAGEPPAPSAEERRLIARMAGVIGPAARALDDQVDGIVGRGFAVRARVAFAAPTPPWLPPSLDAPAVVDRRWQPPVDSAPSSAFRATLAFPSRSLITLAAVAEQTASGWVSRHPQLAVPGAAIALRAEPRMFGGESQSAGRVRAGGGGPLATAGLVAAHDLPGDATTVALRVHAADAFGRFGAPQKVSLAPPPRPLPPRPVLRQRFVPNPDLDRTSALPLVPGTVEVLVDPAATPGIDDMEAGSLPITTLELELAGTALSEDLTVAGLRRVRLPLRALGPQEPGTSTLRGRHVDSAGRKSEPTEIEVRAHDVRAPAVYPTGLGLFWTSAPASAPEVELALAWPAPAGSRHRVFLADQHGMGIGAADLADPFAPASAEPSRGRVAAAGCRRARDGSTIARIGFRLLTDPPIEAGNEGRAVLETVLPRSLATVQFLRIVPLGPDGAEPPFADCGIVPVAVPDDRPPPPPRLDAEVDAVTGRARLTVVAPDFDRVALARDEPGLFVAGAPAPRAPRFRMRRSARPLADPLYARVVAEGELALAADGTTFAASFEDAGSAGAGLEPFVAYVYWADVSLPDERRLPADLVPELPPGGVEPLDPTAALDQPRPFSAPSPGRTVVHVPLGPPDPPVASAMAITLAPGGVGLRALTIALSAPPRAHRLAIDRYRLAVWTQWREGDAGRAFTPALQSDGSTPTRWADIEEGSVTLAVLDPGDLAAGTQLRLRLAFEDPSGRVGTATEVDVA